MLGGVESEKERTQASPAVIGLVDPKGKRRSRKGHTRRHSSTGTTRHDPRVFVERDHVGHLVVLGFMVSVLERIALMPCRQTATRHLDCPACEANDALFETGWTARRLFDGIREACRA